VQDYFITDTARRADLILPATLPFETGGSFTNTQKHLRKFEKQMESPIEKTSHQQLIDLLGKLGINGISDLEEALWEAFKLLPSPEDPEKRKFALRHTEHDNNNRQFNHGCDIVNKYFDEEFEGAFTV
jgi:anaerobic selenocysteine-containing dehydrogenase